MRWYVLGAALMLGLAAQAAQAGPQATAVATVQATVVPTASPATLQSAAKTPMAASEMNSPAVALNASAASSAPAHRYPAVATLLAWFPGVVVHGTGHLYAHSFMKGLGLLALEGASTYLLYEDYVDYKRGSFNNILKNTSNEVPVNLGFEYQQAGIALVAVPAWFFTWIDDVCGAPIAAKQFNQIQEQQAATISLHVQPQPNGVVLALSSNF